MTKNQSLFLSTNTVPQRVLLPRLTSINSRIRGKGPIRIAITRANTEADALAMLELAR